jgi:hypothetical protein
MRRARPTWLIRPLLRWHVGSWQERLLGRLPWRWNSSSLLGVNCVGGLWGIGGAAFPADATGAFSGTPWRRGDAGAGARPGMACLPGGPTCPLNGCALKCPHSCWTICAGSRASAWPCRSEMAGRCFISSCVAEICLFVSAQMPAWRPLAIASGWRLVRFDRDSNASPAFGGSRCHDQRRRAATWAVVPFGFTPGHTLQFIDPSPHGASSATAAAGSDRSALLHSGPVPGGLRAAHRSSRARSCGPSGGTDERRRRLRCHRVGECPASQPPDLTCLTCLASSALAQRRT